MPDSKTEIDERFVARVTEEADAHAERVLAGLDERLAGPVHHRTVMADAKALVACCVHPRSRLRGSDLAAGAVKRLVAHLAAMQGEDGLFDGENLASPPDTAFTINDLCEAYALLDGAAAPGLRAVGGALERIALDAQEALLRGGVHTPNHRWELCAALARMHRHWPDDRFASRVDQWLAEGVDLAPDGMYSERSAIYAAFVSNPSLTAIGLALDRPELLDGVCRNLEAVWATTLPDLTVETVHSRRQDQRGRFDVVPFLMQFRRFAIARGRGDFAGAVEEILTRPLSDPAGALTAILLEPELAGPLPRAESRKPVRRVFASASLAVVRAGECYTSVYGGSDYAEHGRIRSGLASNPTFLRMACGDAVLDAVRLSREFFGMGPFRSEGLDVDGDAFVLRERVGAAYYGPLPVEHRSADGRYELADEGRFSASMDFAHRPSEDVTLDTRMWIRVAERSVELVCETTPASVRQVLELTFRPGGELTGTRERAEGHELVGTAFAYTAGGDRIAVSVEGGRPHPAARLGYHPGEDYTHLSGTDATEGVKVRIPLAASGRTVVKLRGLEGAR